MVAGAAIVFCVSPPEPITYGAGEGAWELFFPRSMSTLITLLSGAGGVITANWPKISEFIKRFTGDKVPAPVIDNAGSVIDALTNGDTSPLALGEKGLILAGMGRRGMVGDMPGVQMYVDLLRHVVELEKPDSGKAVK